MVFSSLIFIFRFLPLTLIGYYLSPKFLKNFVLFTASLMFYAWGEPIYIFIMIFSTVFDYLNGRLIEKFRSNKKASTLVLINSMVVNLGILFFFKYYGFMVDNINTIFHINIQKLSLTLPVGISFYTFQTMSYVIDVYLGKVAIQKNIISFGTYVAMFPQLVAGPIVKYADIAEQLNKRRETMENFAEGIEIFIIGLSKKVLLANNIALLWQAVKPLETSNLSVLTAWLGIIAFTFQIYFDFSGYSDMAIGLGKMFGFNLTKNFNYPYIAKSVTQFWRRWHISLGQWFKEYVYIPLGGNKHGKIVQLRNIFIVWFLTGLWHGASWNFIWWGLYFGILLTVEKVFLLKLFNGKAKIISNIYTMIMVIIGWVFFEFENLGKGIKYIGAMFGFGAKGLIDSQALYYLYTNLILLMMLIICSTPFPKQIYNKIRVKFNNAGMFASALICLSLLFIATAYLVNDTYNPFLYFRF